MKKLNPKVLKTLRHTGRENAWKTDQVMAILYEKAATGEPVTLDDCGWIKAILISGKADVEWFCYQGFRRPKKGRPQVDRDICIYQIYTTEREAGTSRREILKILADTHNINIKDVDTLTTYAKRGKRKVERQRQLLEGGT